MLSHKKNRVPHKLPPGPRNLPLLGSLHEVAQATASSPSHHGLQKLSQKYGPLMHLQLGEVSAVVVSCPDIAKQIMKTHDLAFSYRPELMSSEILTYGYIDIAFAPYGDYWRKMRKICMLELLSAKRVQSFSYIREDEVDKLINSVQSSSGSPVDISSMFVKLISKVVSRAAFGNISSKDQQEFVNLAKEAILVSQKGHDLADLFPSMKPIIQFMSRMRPKLEKIHRRQDKILENIIAENQENQRRRNEEKGDEAGDENIVQVLLRIQHSAKLDIPVTTNSIKAVIWDMFSAGTDTSSTTLEWAMSELMRNPKVREKVQAEIRQTFSEKERMNEGDLDKLSYFKSVIRETLRLHPPLPLLLPRECREPCKIDGYEIHMKTQVIINAWALGRDPNHWHDAERFMPERFEGDGASKGDFKGTNFEYIPFGAGRRMCPGISFGLANLELPLAKLLYHFDWELPNGMKPEDLDMAEASGSIVGRKNNLCLIPIPYVTPP